MASSSSSSGSSGSNAAIVDSLEAEVQQLKNDIKALEEEKKKIVMEIEETKNDIRDREKQRNELRELNKKEMLDEIGKLEYTTTLEQISSKENRLDKLQGESLSLRQEISSKELRILELQKEISSKQLQAQSPVRNIMVQQQQEAQRKVKTILKDGFPLLAPYPILTNSAPSINTGHSPASVVLKDAELSLLSLEQLPEEYYASNIWTSQDARDGKLISWAAEASICNVVNAALIDVIALCKLPLRLQGEVGTFEIRPDMWVLSVDHLPVGVVEVKKPSYDGSIDVMNNAEVLGELYDYMMQLLNIHGTQQAFGILTTYNEWRVCWLQDDASVQLAKSPTTLPFSINTTSAFTTPVKNRQDPATRKVSPPATTPSKRRTNYHTISTEDGDDDDNNNNIAEALAGTYISSRNNDNDRKMNSTKVYLMKDGHKPLLCLLATVLLKMSKVTRTPFQHPFDRLQERTLLCVDQTTCTWSRLPSGVKEKWSMMPKSNVNTLYLLEDLGVGASGHAWLACSVTGAVCVLKFCKDMVRNAEERLKQEYDRWCAIYPEFKVRLARFYNRPALLMPHFDTPKRNEETLSLVETALMEDYAKRGYQHKDVAWRNIGIYQTSGETLKVVIYDMGDIVEFSTGTTDLQKKDWVSKCIEELRAKIKLPN